MSAAEPHGRWAIQESEPPVEMDRSAIGQRGHGAQADPSAGTNQAGHARPAQPPGVPVWSAGMVLVLLVALFMRVYALGHLPVGVHYDEAANVILSTEIAEGARPIFIRAYTGKEVLYFYLAAAAIRLIGHPLIAVRLTSAIVGVLGVALTYRAGRELFAREPGGRGAWIALAAAAIQALTPWAIVVSRLGFRAGVQPPFETLTILYLYRGLSARRGGAGRWLDWALAGLWCGLSAYTYLAIRAFPLLLAAFLVWVLFLGGRGAGSTLARWPARLGRIALLALVAALVFGPLGAFYVRNPQFFGTRMAQVSVLSEEVSGGALWATLWRAVRISFGMFTVRGDMNWRFNAAGAPVFWPPLGACFYAGLLLGLWRLFRRGDAGRRGTYFLLLLWLPIMLLPSILGGSDVELSLTLRAVGVMPAIFYWAALGLVEGALGIERLMGWSRRVIASRGRGPDAVSLVQKVWPRGSAGLFAGGPPPAPPLCGYAPQTPQRTHATGGTRHLASTQWSYGGMALLHHQSPPMKGGRGNAVAREGSPAGSPPGRKPYGRIGRVTVGAVAALLVLLATGAHAFYLCFDVWGPSVPGYYVASGDLVDVARLLNERLPAGADCYVSAEHYRHPTLALLANRYADLKWLVGPDALVFPQASDRETWYVFTHAAMPPQATLERFLGPPHEVHAGPNGRTAFVIYRFPPRQVPVPQPQMAGDANLANTLRYRGYDLNAPLISGRTADLTLYFEALRDGDRDDWAFFAHLVDELGLQWGGKTFFTYPSSQWRAGELMALRCTFATWEGAPPGAYQLDVGTFSASLDARLPLLNERGQMAGTAVHIGPLQMARAPTPPANLPPIQQPLDARWESGLALLGLDRDRGDLRPGETLALSLYWRRGARPAEDAVVSLWLENAGERVSLWQGDPAHGTYPFSRWQPDEFVRDRYALRLPTDVPAGDWTLHLALLRPGGMPFPLAGGSPELSLSTLHVHATDRLWEPPDGLRAVGARLGEVVELVGYDLPGADEGRATVRPGEVLRLRLVWRCLGEMNRGYTVFTHLLDEGEQVRGQQDNPPVGGRYPTTLWVAGEVVVDEYEIEVQADAPPGRYAIEVGMYDPASMQRLPVQDPSGAAGDRILLGTVEVMPE